MGNRMDPRKPFSKWLAKVGSYFWVAYLPALLVVICIRPEAATACVYLGLIVSAVMIIHVWAYTSNSIYEKGLMAMLDKGRMQGTGIDGSGEGTEDGETDTDRESESNG